MGRRGGGRVRGAGEDPDLRRCRRRRVHGCPTFFVEEVVAVHRTGFPDEHSVPGSGQFRMGSQSLQRR
ncbi:hypothetical protein COP1_011882 [Malus domestica]